MLRFDPPEPEAPNPILVAVLTAAATTAVTALIGWAIDELREKYGTKKEEPKKP